MGLKQVKIFQSFFLTIISSLCTVKENEYNRTLVPIHTIPGCILKKSSQEEILKPGMETVWTPFSVKLIRNVFVNFYTQNVLSLNIVNANKHSDPLL